MPKRRKPTQAVQLIALAHTRYSIIVDQSGQTFAVPKDGPRIAVPLNGRGNALTKRLTLDYFRAYGGTPSASAVTSAIQILDAEAMDAPRVPVHLRTAWIDGRLVIDLGDPEGRCVLVEPGAWRVLKRAPDEIVFRRTELTAAMMLPKRGGRLDALRPLVNVTDESWDLLRAWLVLAWMPHVPVPILAVTGPQGTGKSILGRMCVGIVDPSPAPLQSSPRDLAEWQTTAAASRVIGLDNISKIGEWLSDALCRAVTREGAAKRKLYTDQDLVVQTFRRAILLTSIDPGALKGDLGERLMPVELRTIKGRKSETELMGALRRQMPSILGGLLDVTACALADPVKLKNPPRMADAANMIAAVDNVLGSDALGFYISSQKGVLRTVLESDPLASALVTFMGARPGGWTGTATQLFDALVVHGYEVRNWPANARTMSERLARLGPALRDVNGLLFERKRGDERLIALSWKTTRREGGASGASGPRGAGRVVVRRKSRK